MASEVKKEIAFEIGHVLFIDIIGYSKLLINEQSEQIQELKEIVRGTEQFRLAEAEGKLLRLPTGDGGALVFRNSPEAPVMCALEISKELKKHPELRVRMGIHSGPVNEVTDLNEQANIAGAGINIAQRVMDCGDTGHILLSKRVADDLEQYPRWRPCLHELGECEVKHGQKISVVNLYDDEVGNPQRPEKFGKTQEQPAAIAAARHPPRKNLLIAVAALVAIGSAIVLVYFARHANQRSIAIEKSIAVLPFENRSEDKANAYFADGIQDEILTRLAKIAALKVISRTSTKQYDSRPGNLSDIAKQLGVATILEGSVQRVADQVHINVQLIRATTGEHLWAESYDRKIKNIFAVEAEVASSVAKALNAKLTGVEEHALQQKPTSDPEAYEAYLRGIALWGDPSTSDDVSEAAHSFEKAVRLDPNFAIAWAVLAQIHSDLYFLAEATPDQRMAAQNSLETAMRLQPDSPEVQEAHAFYEYKVLRDLDAARRSFEQLHTKLPNNADICEALGSIMLQLGRWDESRADFDWAIELSPRNRGLRLDAAFVRRATRDFPNALQCYDQALAIWPDEAVLIASKASVYQSLGELDRADTLLDKVHPTPTRLAGLATICHQAVLRRRYTDAIRLSQDSLQRANSLPSLWRSFYRMQLADLQRLSGDLANARASYVELRDELERRLKQQPEDTESTLQLAEAYAGLGDSERAIKYTERVISLKPASQDAWIGPRYEEKRARIAARFRQNDLAISILEHLLKTTYQDAITPALLRLDPDFDLLRGDPRFEKLASGE